MTTKDLKKNSTTKKKPSFDDGAKVIEEIPLEQLIAYIVAKLDHLGDLIEERIPPIEKLK